VDGLHSWRVSVAVALNSHPVDRATHQNVHPRRGRLFAIVSDSHGNSTFHRSAGGDLRAWHQPNHLTWRCRRIRPQSHGVPRLVIRLSRPANGPSRLCRLLRALSSFNSGAEAGLLLDRQCLSTIKDLKPSRRALAILAPTTRRIPNPRNRRRPSFTGRPSHEYIFPGRHLHQSGKFVHYLNASKLCFMRQTYVPGVFLEGPDFF